MLNMGLEKVKTSLNIFNSKYLWKKLLNNSNGVIAISNKIKSDGLF